MTSPASKCKKVKVPFLKFIGFVFLLFFPSFVTAEISFRLKSQIIGAAETLPIITEAFFHDGGMDTDYGNQLGVYFAKDFLAAEDKRFFENYTRQVCLKIANQTEFSGDLDIYFYQRTLIRKYNEEGKASCNIYDSRVRWIKIHSRVDRYFESGMKWGIKTVSGTWKFFFENP